MSKQAENENTHLLQIESFRQALHNVMEDLAKDHGCSAKILYIPDKALGYRGEIRSLNQNLAWETWFYETEAGAMAAVCHILRARISSELQVLKREASVMVTRINSAMADAERYGISGETAVDCPGTGACHGSQVWCDRCGDVKSTCDFPFCDIHAKEPQP